MHQCRCVNHLFPLIQSVSMALSFFEDMNDDLVLGYTNQPLEQFNSLAVAAPSIYPSILYLLFVRLFLFALSIPCHSIASICSPLLFIRSFSLFHSWTHWFHIDAYRIQLLKRKDELKRMTPSWNSTIALSHTKYRKCKLWLYIVILCYIQCCCWLVDFTMRIVECERSMIYSIPD